MAFYSKTYYKVRVLLVHRRLPELQKFKDFTLKVQRNISVHRFHKPPLSLKPWSRSYPIALPFKEASSQKGCNPSRQEAPI